MIDNIHFVILLLIIINIIISTVITVMYQCDKPVPKTLQFTFGTLSFIVAMMISTLIHQRVDNLPLYLTLIWFIIGMLVFYRLTWPGREA